MYQGLKNAVHEEASNSSFHGISRLAGSEHILRKLIWLCCMAVSYTYCMIIIARNVDEYYTYPVITNINRVYEQQPEFPMITFCNTNIRQCGFNQNSCQGLIIGFGRCYIFNRGKNVTHHELPIVKSEKPGKAYGLYLELNQLNLNPGIQIYINNQSVRRDDDKAIMISVGMETNLVISRNLENKLSYPHSNCKTDYTFELGSEDHFNKTSYPYFQSECFYLCQFEKLFEATNKTEEYFQNFQYYFTNYNKWAYSTGSGPSDYPDIFQDIVKNLLTLGKNKYCEDICPIECNSITYSVTPFYKYRSEPSAFISIYFEDFIHTEMTEIPKITIDGFVSVLGGTLGLFLGTSLLSFVEVLDFLAALVHVVFKSKRVKGTRVARHHISKHHVNKHHVNSIHVKTPVQVE